MLSTTKAKTRAAGTRVDQGWQPRYVGGSLDSVNWKGWTVDEARPLVDLARAHLRTCRDQNLALKTVEGYDRVAGALIAFVEREQVETGQPALATVGDLETQTIYRYLHRPAARGGGALSIGAQRSEGGAVKALASFGVRIGAVAPEALRAFDLPKPDEESVPTYLGKAETRRLMRHLEKDLSFEGIRFLLWCQLALDTGMRPAEQEGIEVARIDREDKSIRILGKRNRYRTISYGEITAKTLERYLLVRGEMDEPRLFVGHRGQMRGESFSKTFRRIADELGLKVEGGDDDASGKEATLYILRRTFAHNFAERTDAQGRPQPVEVLAALMGHSPSSIPMLLKLYYRPSHERLARAHREASPLDGLFAEAA